MLLTADVEQRLTDLVRAKTPQKYQTDHEFLCGLVTSTFRKHADTETVQKQLLTELRTYFEEDTEAVVRLLLDEVPAPRSKRSANADNPQPEKKPKLTDVSRTTLFVKRIPKDLNSIEQINTHFKQFGEILNVQVYPNKNAAQVCFATEDAAAAALASKEPVLGSKAIALTAFRFKKKQENPQVKVKQVARELKIKKKELSKEKTDMIQSLLKVLNDRKNELSPEQQRELLEKIRTLGVAE